ncbi:GNAT family N-acetyltransferase [Paenibacillus sp. p3-SID1389]|uniref:GNAT family N-acetyltransferase n=1 Tax=Paenibacillus sp. p3-SID1389 TaxID=2916364 RepID=UPI0021A40576|nr:GNAT family N-acetyltransferase [Paenibacillus sp. p3-SID1389]MCT2197279.1 GNAT family N-acetyltransferase [Paenibacillus sp. p3-SID1389]
MMTLSRQSHPVLRDVERLVQLETELTKFNNERSLIEQSRGGDGSALDEGMVKRKIRYYYRDDFQNFVAYLGGEPAGMGSLFMRGDTGYLANDFTFPAYRKRGIQTALIRHRLQTARELGLKRVYTDVEFASASHANMLKCGFELVYVNTFWMKMALPR